MNNIDKQYQELLQDILDNGVIKSDRTGTGTKSVFGRQIRHKMSEGFPLLTTKKMAWKTMVVELLWFLRGDTNIKFLLDYDCHIWDGDAYKRYVTHWGNPIDPINYELYGPNTTMNCFHEDKRLYTKEEFIKQIKTDETFAKQWGELGPIYGKQWRKWSSDNVVTGKYKLEKNLPEGMVVLESTKIDQIDDLVRELKTNPDSRRLMVNAWNVGDLDQMVLPPCHYGFQVYTKELSEIERGILYSKKMEGYVDTDDVKTTEHYDGMNIPKRAISLMWNQRSVDVPLGLPFNIASYGLLLEIIAKEVNMVPDQLIGNLGDCHIYLNQIDGVKEQISRTSFELPSVKINERNWYQHEKVKEHLGEKTFSEKILSYRPDCFELIGYQSHSKIKIPLSN
jgi:thymidylate synthase